MARNYGSRRSSSKGMRNLGSAANGIGKIADKGFQALARQNASVASHAVLSSSIMELMWDANCSMACMDLRFRRFDRLMNNHNRLMNGEKTSVFEIFYGWIIDHLPFSGMCCGESLSRS